MFKVSVTRRFEFIEKAFIAQYVGLKKRLKSCEILAAPQKTD